VTVKGDTIDAFAPIKQTDDERPAMYQHPRTGSLAALSLLLAALAGPPAWGAAAPDHQPRLIEETGQGFEIKAAVPVFAGTGGGPDADAALTSANRDLLTEIETLIAAFRNEHQEEAARGGIQGADWSLLIEHEPPERGARYLAVLITGYDFRGGAHGMPIIEPRVFALADGRRIPPQGLFRPDTDWLGRLAARCYAELKLRDLAGTDDTWLRSGTEPKAENYRLLLPTPAGLRVIFPPYAVAAYAQGTQEVLIPYRDLAGLLEPTLFGEPEPLQPPTTAH
jgi:hypothetical protein